MLLQHPCLTAASPYLLCAVSKWWYLALSVVLALLFSAYLVRTRPEGRHSVQGVAVARAAARVRAAWLANTPLLLSFPSPSCRSMTSSCWSVAKAWRSLRMSMSRRRCKSTWVSLLRGPPGRRVVARCAGPTRDRWWAANAVLSRPLRILPLPCLPYTDVINLFLAILNIGAWRRWVQLCVHLLCTFATLRMLPLSPAPVAHAQLPTAPDLLAVGIASSN